MIKNPKLYLSTVNTVIAIFNISCYIELTKFQWKISSTFPYRTWNTYLSNKANLEIYANSYLLLLQSSNDLDQLLDCYWVLDEPGLRTLSDILLDRRWFCSMLVYRYSKDSRYDDWQQPLHLEENNALQRLAEPLRATHIFSSEAGPLFWSGVCRQVHFSFWWGTTWPHGPSSRERRNSRRIKGSRGFCDEGVEGLNRVYANRLFLWRVPKTNLNQVLKCCLSSLHKSTYLGSSKITPMSWELMLKCCRSSSFPLRRRTAQR